MSDKVYSGLRFRVLSLIDEGVREALHIVVDTFYHSGTSCPDSGATESRPIRSQGNPPGQWIRDNALGIHRLVQGE